jgi:hypothetical protein
MNLTIYLLLRLCTQQLTGAMPETHEEFTAGLHELLPKLFDVQAMKQEWTAGKQTNVGLTIDEMYK